jgi:GGDEF domain-containing protein
MKYMQCCRRALGALLLLAATAAPLAARTVLDLDVARQPVALQDWGDAWIDDRAQVTVEAVGTDPGIAWRPTRDDAIYPLATGKVLWIRFTIPPAPDAERWYLEIPYPSVDRVSLFTLDTSGRWQVQQAGDHVPVSQWPVPHRYPLFPLLVSAEDPRHYLLRVENSHSFSAPLDFVSEGALLGREQRTSLILGIYFGLAGLAALLGALSAISLRDRAYALYALSVTLMALSQAALTGIAGLHLWPDLPWWNDQAPLVLPVFTLAALLRFFSELVSVGERSPSLQRWLMFLALLSLPVATAIMLFEPSHRVQLMVPYIVAMAAVLVGTLLWAARRGDRFAMWALIGSLPVMAGSVFPLARAAGVMSANFWTLYGMQVGIAVELPTLLLILIMHSQQRREHQRRVHGLDRIDPATGLLSAPVFFERLVRLIARSQRLHYPSAVLLVEIVNMDQLRRDFGARSVEDLPLRVAGRLLATAREIDHVARLSPLRFGMLVEGPLTPEEASAIGPRVVARCLMPFTDKPVEWVAQVRVAQTAVPIDNSDAKDVLSGLESLLASVAPENRRAVFTWKPQQA